MVCLEKKLERDEGDWILKREAKRKGVPMWTLEDYF